MNFITNMLHAAKHCLENTINIKGRTSRTEFWLTVFAYFVILCGFGVLRSFGIPGLWRISLLFSFVAWLPMLTMGVRRLHDSGKDGAYIFFSLIPIAGLAIMLYFYIQPSDPEENKWGECPEDINDFEDLFNTVVYEE